MGYQIDLRGQKYGRLTVIEFVGNDKHYNSLWKCQCDCGNIITINSNRLRTGNTKSCGCALTDCLRKRNFRHGLYFTRLHGIHSKMLARCYNPHNKRYKNYGARGISVCEEWRGDHGFVNFYNWANENGYRDDLTIDRIDTNKNYSPDNCRWATYQEQENNRTNNRYVKVNGEIDTVANLARKYNVPYGSLLKYSHGKPNKKHKDLRIEVV